MIMMVSKLDQMDNVKDQGLNWMNFWITILCLTWIILNYVHVPLISLSQTTANKADWIRYINNDLRQIRMRC